MKKRPLIVAILLLATFLRFHNLEVQSFWNDEGNSARLSERSIPLIIEGTASDIHPPLYYLMLRGWRGPLGETEFSLRGLSAFAGVLTVAFTAVLGCWLGGRRAGYVAGLLTAVSPPLVYYSQEARMYALLALLAVASTAVLWRWLQSRSNWRLAAVYVLLTTAGLYTHYFFPAVLLGHNLLVTARWLRGIYALVSQPTQLAEKRPLIRQLTSWVVIMALTFGAYLPWLPIFIRQAGGRPTVRPPLPDFLADAGRWLVFGATVTAENTRWASWAVLALLALALWRGGRRVWLPALATAVPVIFMWLAGATRPEFYKFMGVTVPFLSLTVAAGMIDERRLMIKDRRSHRVAQPLNRFNPSVINLLMAVLLLPIGYGLAVSLANLYTNPVYARDDYRAMAARVEAGGSEVGVILNAPNQWEVFTYYFDDVDRVYPLPRGRPEAASIDAELAQIATTHERLYALYWGEGQRDPERLVERWLDSNAFKATEEWVGDVRFVSYAVPPEPASVMETAAAVQFGETITLRGYTLGGISFAPGEIVPLTLFWETAVGLETRYKVFIHLLDENGVLRAQRDSEPGGGLNPTINWQPRETIVDNHGLFLPPELPAGNYRLVAGLYDSLDPGARLSSATGDDSYQLGEIKVVAP